MTRSFKKVNMRLNECRRRFLPVFARLVVVLLITNLVYMVIYMRMNYNLKGYYISTLPKSFIAIYELLARSGRVTYISTKAESNTIRTHKMNNLYSLPTITMPVNRSTNKQIHNILWFNKPNFIHTDTINGVLQSRECVYNNCIMTTDKTLLMSSSAIIFWFELLNLSPPISPLNRSKDQAWIFYGVESPPYHLYYGNRHSAWQNTMNWSMTYRLDSDIPAPYGYLEMRPNLPTKDYSAIYRSKTKFAAWFVSNCGAMSFRDEYVKEMESEGIKVDKYGGCVWDSHHSRYDLEQRLNRDYMFYLGFENSLCKDYITEKYFSNLKLDVVPVVRGGANYNKLLPKDTFINTAEFRSAKELVAYMKRVSANETEYIALLRNTDKYNVLDDPLNRNMYTWCHLCEKLNNLEKHRKTYKDMVDFLVDGSCVVANDISVIWFLILPCFICVIIFLISVCVYNRYRLRRKKTVFEM